MAQQGEINLKSKVNLRWWRTAGKVQARPIMQRKHGSYERSINEIACGGTRELFVFLYISYRVSEKKNGDVRKTEALEAI